MIDNAIAIGIFRSLQASFICMIFFIGCFFGNDLSWCETNGVQAQSWKIGKLKEHKLFLRGVNFFLNSAVSSVSPSLFSLTVNNTRNVGFFIFSFGTNFLCQSLNHAALLFLLKLWYLWNWKKKMLFKFVRLMSLSKNERVDLLTSSHINLNNVGKLL